MCLESTREETVIVHDICKTRSARKKKIRRNAAGETQLHTAARRGNVSLVKTLISSGICVNEQDYAGLKITLSWICFILQFYIICSIDMFI